MTSQNRLTKNFWPVEESSNRLFYFKFAIGWSIALVVIVIGFNAIVNHFFE